MAITAKKITSTTVLKGVSPSSKALPVLSNDFNPVIDDLTALYAQITGGTGDVVTDDLTVNDDATITGDLAVTGATTLGIVNYKAQVTDTGGAYATPVVLTAAQSGRKILVDDAAGLDFTLPAIAAAEVGTTFEFFVTVSVTSNNFRVTAATGDLMTGSILLVDDTAAYTAPQAVVKKPATTFLVMTMNGTTTGGKIGTRVKFTATSATQWFVEGVANGSGVLATPFS